MALLIADISSHNTVTSWPAFLGSVDGVIVKVTQGTSYVWSGAQNALSQSRNAGKLTGAYHFAGDLVGSVTVPGDPVAEADYFLAHYGHVDGEPIVLDWEPTGFRGDPDAWGYAWCQRVISRTRVVPMVYLNHFYAASQSQWPRTRSLGCALWAAWYGANTGQPLPGMPSFAPWPPPAMWQYTSLGSRPGVSGPLDLSQFYGSADQWRAYGKGGQPATTPGGPEMRLARTPDGTIWAVTDTRVVALTDPNLANDLAAVWGPPVALQSAAGVSGFADQVRGLAEGTLVGYGARIERIDEGLHGGWGYGNRIEDTQTKVTALGSQPTVDAAAVAALVLAGIKAQMAADVTPPAAS